MAARAFPGTGGSHTTRFGGMSDFDDEAHEMFPGERVGAPLAATGMSALAKARLLILTLAAGGAVMALSDRGLPDWLTTKISGLAGSQVAEAVPGAAPERRLAEPLPAEAQPAAAAEPAEPPPLPEAVIEDKAGAPAQEAAAVPYDAQAEASAPARLEPPVIDRDDPYQAKALAAGLHPGLSRVLLAKLTAEDYRNAGKAIQTALAGTADDGVLKWPPKPAPGKALFEVHFVPGAVPECRRYVVTVTLGGWSTTALPMERCVAGRQKPKAG